VNLFRAQKCSTRAKVYRGGLRGIGSFRSLAYQRKAWSMKNLCDCLAEHGSELGINFGWKRDPNTPLHDAPSWVLYVDLPQGQVSFHSPTRYAGPDYPASGMACARAAKRCSRSARAVLSLSRSRRIYFRRRLLNEL